MGFLRRQQRNGGGPAAHQELSDYGVFQPIQIASIIA
jgi:predicted flap endonuclease-1-like 5' DNA nuclease